MTTIKSWFATYTLEDFLQDKYGEMKKNNCLPQYEIKYDATKNYNKDDKITIKNGYTYYYYVSLQNNNIGHNYDEEEWWEKQEEILEIYREQDFNADKELSMNLNYFALNKKADEKYKNLLLLSIEANIFNSQNGTQMEIVNSASMDGLSIGGEVIGLVKTYPWLNNAIGMHYLLLRSQLITNTDIYGKRTARVQMVSLKP